MERKSLKSQLSDNPPTKPWDPSENIWHSDMFRLKAKRPGFRQRFVSAINVEKKELQGWTVANRSDYGGLADEKIQDGKGLDTRILRRGMVLMELPEEMAKAREAWHERRNKQGESDAKARVKKAAAEVNREIGDGITVFDESKHS